MIGVETLYSSFRAGPLKCGMTKKSSKLLKKLQHRLAMYKTNSGPAKPSLVCIEVWQLDSCRGKKRFCLLLGMCRILDPGQHPSLQPKPSVLPT